MAANMIEKGIFFFPNDWDYVPISKVILQTKLRDPGKKPDDEIKYVDVSGVSNELFKVKVFSILKGREAPSRARKIIETDDVIFATVRPTLRRVAIIEPYLNNELCSTGYCVLKANKSLMDFRFLYFFLLTDFYINQIQKYERGASYPAVSDSVVKSINIPKPSIQEQNNIANILSLIQSAIQKQEKIISTATELKNVLMKRFFTEGMNDEPLKETEIGLIPESWEVKKAGEFCNIRTNTLSFSEINSVQSNNSNDIHALALKVSDMNLSGNESLISKAIIEFTISPLNKKLSKFIKPGSIIFPKRGAAIATNKKRLLNHYSILDPNLIALEPDTSCDVGYLYYYFLTIDLRKITDNNTIPQLNKKDLDPFLIPLPKMKEQLEIKAALDTMDSKVVHHKSKKKLLQTLFNSLLLNLMTGTVRVKDKFSEKIIEVES